MADDRSAPRAVYDATVDTYIAFAGTTITSATETDADVEVLSRFATSVTCPAGVVADIGCGPGRVSAFLRGRGLRVVGFDLSFEMVAAGTRANPSATFAQADLAALPVAAGSLAGAVCWYSIIHTPPDQLAAIAGELARALAAGAPLLVAFQSGAGEAAVRDNAYGTGIALTSYRHDTSAVVDVVENVGLRTVEEVTRAPELPHETTPQSFVRAVR